MFACICVIFRANIGSWDCVKLIKQRSFGTKVSAPWMGHTSIVAMAAHYACLQRRFFICYLSCSLRSSRRDTTPKVPRQAQSKGFFCQAAVTHVPAFWAKASLLTDSCWCKATSYERGFSWKHVQLSIGSKIVSWQQSQKLCPSCSCTRHPGHSLPPGAVHCASISSEIIISCALKALKKFVENPWKNIPWHTSTPENNDIPPWRPWIGRQEYHRPHAPSVFQ